MESPPFAGEKAMVDIGSQRSPRGSCGHRDVPPTSIGLCYQAMFSSRTRWELSPNQLSLRLEKRRRAGLPILDLTESNPTGCEISYPSDEILAALSSPGSLIYEPSPKGLLEARVAIARYYAERGAKVDPEQIIMTASTSEAYAFIFRLLANPQDRIVVPRPSYPLIDFLATLNDVHIDPYPLRYERGWRIDFGTLAGSVSDRSRAILLVNPNNPTGSFLQRGERDSLVEFCRVRELAIVSDEVFADYAFVPNRDRVETMAGTREALTFALGGISKLLGLPQMKLAWICASGPVDLLNRALGRLEVIADTYLSVNTPAQRALPRWLALCDELTQQIRTRVLMNRRYLIDPSQASPVYTCLDAEGGWYSVLRIPEIESEERLVLELLDSEGVLVHPGYFYDFDTDGYLVVSLLPPTPIFQCGIDRMLMHLRAKAHRG